MPPVRHRREDPSGHGHWTAVLSPEWYGSPFRPRTSHILRSAAHRLTLFYSCQRTSSTGDAVSQLFECLDEVTSTDDTHNALFVAIPQSSRCNALLMQRVESLSNGEIYIQDNHFATLRYQLKRLVCMQKIVYHLQRILLGTQGIDHACFWKASVVTGSFLSVRRCGIS